MTQLALSSVLDLAQGIRQGALSPLEVTQYFLERIERYDAQLGSFTYVAAEQALAEARTKTEQWSKNQDLPPFWGVPISIKDLNAVAGMPTGYGVQALQQQPTAYDDGLVMRLKQAGFIILGKTATSELGSFPYTETPGLAPARNPWHLDYTPGGSSGGAAAALAAGLCPIAQGSDGGGSLRGPASACGLVGLKPSRGRISNAPLGDFQSGIASQGALTRTVREAAALLDVMAGYTTGDPYWLESPSIPFVQALQQNVPPLRLAYSFAMAPFSPQDGVGQQAVEKAMTVFAQQGHSLKAACFEAQGLVEPFTRIWQAGVGAAGIPFELLSPVNRWLGETQGTAGDYLQAVRQMQILSRQIVAFFDQYDALILPVYHHQPIRIGQWADLSPAETVQKIIEWVAPCPPMNASGLPAITLPVGFDSQGLPFGVQLVGKPAGEAQLLALAHQLETNLSFPRQLPPQFLD
ncbi:amidase [Synechocystis sp. LKSZ1]|uniref:amidase n=1 Tax=Synechocystis sp. LKSZ1 TaxID=3144951 RepID=UPI00336BE868